MLLPMLRVALRDFRRRPLQAGLMILGVALGVAVVVAIDLASVNATRAFTTSTEALVGRATHQLRGGPSGLPEELYLRLRTDLGMRASAPIVEGIALALDYDMQPLQILGVDPLAEQPFRPFLQQAAAFESGLADFYTRPDTIILGEQLAGRLGIQPGGPLRLQVGDRIETLAVMGILAGQGGELGGDLGSILLTDISTAQELLGMIGRLSRIDLILDQDAETELLSLLPPGATLVTASQEKGTAAQLTSAFRLNLTALSLLALVVGLFLVYNTMAFSILQRRRILGTLRSLGAPGRQIWLMIMLEAVAIAALGSAAGMGLGWLMAQAAIDLMVRTINDLYFPLSITQVELDGAVLLKGLLLGLLAGGLAAVLPAAEAARVPPVNVQRRSDLERAVRSWLPRVSAIGAGMLILGSLVLVAIPDSLFASFAGIFGLLLGVAMLCPIASIGLFRLIARWGPSFAGAIGRMGPRTLSRSISRTGTAIAALMVALSVSIGVGLMISSFRDTVDHWLDLTLKADIYISSPALSAGQPGVTLPPELEQRIRQVPGVDVIEPFRVVEIDSQFGEIQLAVVDARRQRDRDLYRFAAGSAQSIWQQVLNGAVIVSEPFMYRYLSGAVGAPIQLRTDSGLREFPVAAVFYDYSTDRGSVMMSRATYRQHWDDPGLTSLGVFAAPGESTADLAERLRANLAGTGLQVQVNRQLRQQALAIFDQTFAITAALRALAVAVAIVGVLSTLLALQLERTGELGTLRSLGLTPAGLSSLAFWESGLIGISATLWALPTGLMLALLLIYIINLRSFGWTIQLSSDPGPFLQALAIGIFAALASAVYPVHRLRQMVVAEALRRNWEAG